jgi:hypothetical protein
MREIGELQNPSGLTNKKTYTVKFRDIYGEVRKLIPRSDQRYTEKFADKYGEVYPELLIRLEQDDFQEIKSPGIK